MTHPVRLSHAALVPTAEPVAGDAGPTSLMFGPGIPDPETYPWEVFQRETQKVLADRSLDLGYSRFAGQPNLRAAISGRLKARSSASVSPDNIAITLGTSGAIKLASAALINPGDVVVAEQLTYPGAPKIFRQRGAEVVGVPTDADGMDPVVFEETLRRVVAEGRAVAAVYLVAPFQSPTTARLTDARAAQLVEVAARYNVLLLIDDTYGEIDFTGSPSMPGVLFESGQALHLGSFSKTLAPALRLGWVAGNAEAVAAMCAMRMDIGQSLILQETVAQMIDSGEYAQHLDYISTFYSRKLDILLEGLEKSCAQHATWTRPVGSFFLWLATNVDVAETSRHAKSEGVGFVPDSTFAVDGRSSGHIRLAYGFLGTELLAEGAARLGRSMDLAAESSPS